MKITRSRRIMLIAAIVVAGVWIFVGGRISRPAVLIHQVKLGQTRDEVIAATQANLFAKIDGRWTTPALDECGVAGVMRRAFRHWRAGQGEEVAERRLARADVESASALLLTNALIGAWPVRELAGRKFGVDGAAREFNAWLARQ